MGRDGNEYELDMTGDEFQSTRPRGARPVRTVLSAPFLMFQSTRPRGARREVDGGIGILSRVSIHAPTWGATAGRSLRDSRVRVSIHAPTWGATRPRPRPASLLRVSIHAPTWGATSGCSSSSRSMRFQSTRPRGARLSVASLVQCSQIVSIHAPTWGATPPGSAHRWASEFQSTRPRGARHCYTLPHRCLVVVSIHAPTWGAT